MDHAENPFFKNMGREAYEIAYLLRDTPIASVTIHKSLPDEETTNRFAALAKHSENAMLTIYDGLEVLGEMLTKIGIHASENFDPKRLVPIGGLIKHLAVELQVLDETRGDSEYALAKVAEAKAATPAKKGASK